MTKYFLDPQSLSGKVKVETDLPNYATKIDKLIHQNLLKKLIQLLKSEVDKLHTDKLKNPPTNLSNLKSKVDKLDIDKLVPVPVDLSKVSDVVKNVVAKDVCI